MPKPKPKHRCEDSELMLDDVIAEAWRGVLGREGKGREFWSMAIEVLRLAHPQVVLLSRGNCSIVYL